MKRWVVRIMSVVALLCLLSYLLGSIDYWRVQKHLPPLFVVNWGGFFDGGTMVGCGLGYTVASNHGGKYFLEHRNPGEVAYITEGPELDFWFFPFLNKSELKFMPEEFLR